MLTTLVSADTRPRVQELARAEATELCEGAGI
jgi:hypothetical protein